MTEQITPRSEIAERAREAAAYFLKTGQVPLNAFPALSESARLFDLDFRRFVAGGEVDETLESGA